MHDVKVSVIGGEGRGTQCEAQSCELQNDTCAKSHKFSPRLCKSLVRLRWMNCPSMQTNCVGAVHGLVLRSQARKLPASFGSNPSSEWKLPGLEKKKNLGQ